MKTIKTLGAYALLCCPWALLAYAAAPELFR